MSTEASPSPPVASPGSLAVRTLSRAGRAYRIGVREASIGGVRRPPLVVFNGLGASLELLEPFAAALGDRTLIVIDAPGVGTPAPPAPYRFPALARHASEMLAELGCAEGAVDVLGVSWGGCLAQQFARQYPARCRRLVLAATSPGILMVPGRPAALLGTLGAALHPGPDDPARMASWALGTDFRTRPEELRAQVGRLAPSTLLGQLWQLSAFWTWSSLWWLWQLRQPTLILAGRHDALVPLANARLLEALIPDARLSVLEAGHGFLMTRAEEAARRVREFLCAEPGAIGDGS